MEDLKNIVATTLESKGVLAKIRAELRAHVFQAIEEQESVSSRHGSAGGAAESATARRLRGLTATPAASLVLDLVREWLDFYELDYTSSTLTAEARLGVHGSGHGHASPTAPRDRAALSQALHLPPPTDQRPLLLDLLLQAQGQGQPLVQPRPVPTHSPSNSYSDERVFEQPPRAAVAQPISSAVDAEPELLSPPSSGRMALSRRSGEGDSMMGSGAYKTMQASSSSPPQQGSSNSPTATSPVSASMAGAQGASESPTSAAAAAAAADASAATGAGTAGRRRRDRNLDMAAVHTLVQAPSPNNAAAAAAASTAASASAVPSASSGSSQSTSSSSSSSSLSKLAPLPSLALNRSAPLPPVDVPFIDLDGSSDVDGSTAELDRDGGGGGGGGGGRGGRVDQLSSSIDESMSMEANSVDLDKQRLEEVNRMIRSYEQQGKMPASESTSSAEASRSNSRVHSASQSRENYDGLNTAGSKQHPQQHASALAPTADEDEYENEEFAASDVAGGSGSGEAIEESLEVEEEDQESASMGGMGMGGMGGGRGDGDAGASRGAEDSLDAEYFASSSSLLEQGRKHSLPAVGAGRRAQFPPRIASHSSAEEQSMEQSHHSIEADGDGNDGSYADQASMDEAQEHDHDRHGQEQEQEQEQQRDLTDVYSEDMSVNEPLDADWDYTEEVEVVRR